MMEHDEAVPETMSALDAAYCLFRQEPELPQLITIILAMNDAPLYQLHRRDGAVSVIELTTQQTDLDIPPRTLADVVREALRSPCQPDLVIGPAERAFRIPASSLDTVLEILSATRG